MTEVADAFRDFYADRLAIGMRGSDRRIGEAFRKVPREKFLGDGPWYVNVLNSYVCTPTDDPTILYQDIAVALDRDKGIHNGQPSLHARCLRALAIEEGESIFHVGCGTGYYSAIIAELAGNSGFVEAVELDEELAALATTALSDRENVNVSCETGDEVPNPSVDVIYVSAGVTHPLDSWLESLSDGGRLLLPLSPHDALGGLFVIKRSADQYSAKLIDRVRFVSYEGRAYQKRFERPLLAALRNPSIVDVESLVMGGSTYDDSCWYHWTGGWFSTRNR